MSNWALFTYLITWIICIAAIAVTPLFSPPTIRFGIAIPLEHREHPAIVRLIKRYLTFTITLGVLLAAATTFWFRFDIEQSSGAMTSALLIYLAACYTAYFVCHRTMSRLKQSNGWATPESQQVVTVDTAFREKLSPSLLLTLLPFLVIAVNVAWVALYYEHIQEVLPLHFDASGQADRYGSKSIGTVFTPNIIQASIALLMLGAQQIVLRSKQQLDSTSPAASRDRNTAYRREGIYFIQSLSLIVVILLSLAQLTMLEILPASSVIPVTTLLPLLAIGFYTLRIVRLVKNGRAISPSGSVPVGKDDHWKWGLFYVNPKDRSLFVEKRFGVGWTINFAHPAGWLVFLGILMIPLLAFLFQKS